MTVALAAAAFLGGAVISLATSWLLVSRLERVGERLGLSEALLGLVAALAADAPEVTSAIAAMAGHQQQLGAGVVIGSNVFNLAALLGLGAVVAGRIVLHRRVVVLAGTVAMWVAAACLVVILGLVPAGVGLIGALAAIALYAVVLGISPRGLARLPLPRPWTGWLHSAVAEEELELQDAIRPLRGRRRDALVSIAALLVVIAASVMMERAASALGSRFAVPEIVVGGLVLAAVTSLPNAVAAVYLARRGRGAATLSTALNSNALNVTIGLLIPAVVTGLGRPSEQSALIAAWYIGLTAAVLILAYRDRGISRATGMFVVIAYLFFAGSLLASAYVPWHPYWIASAAAAALALVFGARLAVARQAVARAPGSRRWVALPGPGSQARSRQDPDATAYCNGSQPTPGFRCLRRLAAAKSLVPGWLVGRLWLLGLTVTAVIAAADAALGTRVVLIGLLIAGPCCVLLTGRWVPTGLTGLWATGLAVALGVPDGVWGTYTHLAFLAAVAVVAMACTLAAAAVQACRPQGPR